MIHVTDWRNVKYTILWKAFIGLLIAVADNLIFNNIQDLPLRLDLLTKFNKWQLSRGC